MVVRDTVKLFDSFLQSRGVQFEATVIGAAALVLLDVLVRQTIDVDCLSPKISDQISVLANEFRLLNPNLDLVSNWLNNGPESLLKDLPADWKKNVITLYRGNAIHFTTLCRSDLLKTKLFAFCDRGDDLKDCIAMKPSLEELDAAIEWVKDRDANREWPAHVVNRFDLLKKRLGYV